MKTQVVLIRWVDSHFLPEWHSKYDFESPALDCLSAGILIKKDKKFITIALCISSGQIGNMITIPRKCISGIEILKEFDWDALTP